MADASSFHKLSNSRSSRAGIAESSNQSSSVLLLLQFRSHKYIVTSVTVPFKTQSYNLSLDPQASHHFHFRYPQTTGESAFEYAAKPMEDYSQPTHRATATSSSSRLIRPTSNSTMPGEIVEAPRGGHIIKATGRKDRHSKVCTAKGPRDRRVRLAAHTAIQFYDVQDRLGYDRPSKAVDWLIKKAKAAIDELDELPPWQPPPPTSPNIPAVSSAHEAAGNSGCVRFSLTEDFSGDRRIVGGGSGVAEMVNNQNSSNFLPPSMHSDSIADTIKSFFPMGAAAAETPCGYPPDLLSRTSSQSQDLRLSLQSFQDPILQLHHHHHHQQQQQNEQGFLGFDSSAATWQEHHHHNQQQAELNRFQRMLTWNNAGGGGETNHHNSSTNGVGGSGGGFTFSSLPLSNSPQPFLFGGQSQLFTSQRGPLQSSNAPPIHAWIDQHDHITDHQHHQMAPSTMHHHQHQQQSSISGMGYASGVFPGFHIPTRIQGEEEQHDGISDKPSSASSNSRH